MAMKALFLQTVLVSAFSLSAAHAAGDVASVLRANHKAVGSFPQAGTLEFDYGYSGNGMTGVDIFMPPATRSFGITVNAGF